MKRVLFVLLSLGLLSLPTFAQDAIFEADFEDGEIPSEMLVSENQWVVEDGILRSEVTDEISFFSLDITNDLPAYTLLMELKVTGTEGFWLQTHSDLSNPDCLIGHYFSVSLTLDAVFVGSMNEVCKDTYFDTTEKFPGEQWVNLQMDVTASSMTVTVDDTVILDESVPELVPGDLQFAVFEETTVEIDSIQIVANDTRLPATAEKIVLAEYDGNYQDAIAELQQKDLIPKGGRLLFTEDYAFFTGRGSWFTALAANSPRQNVVMSGEITFQSGGSDVEICGLSSRLVSQRGGGTNTFVSASFLSDGTALIVDNIDGETNAIAGLPLNLDFEQPHHLMVILIDDRASLFVDGQPIVQDLEVEARAGTYGISLISESASSRCEGRNIWVYSLD